MLVTPEARKTKTLPGHGTPSPGWLKTTVLMPEAREEVTPSPGRGEHLALGARRWGYRDAFGPHYGALRGVKTYGASGDHRRARSTPISAALTPRPAGSSTLKDGPKPPTRSG